LKTIENELSTLNSNYEKLRDEHAVVNEDLTKCRYDLEQIELSDSSHKERVNKKLNKKKNYDIYLVNTING